MSSLSPQIHRHENKRPKVKIDDDPDYRNWLALPDDLLRSVTGRLFVSYRDTLAFAGVCATWRSFASPLPPVLLHFNPNARRFPPQFKALSKSSTIQSNLPIKELWLKACVGYSHRHLIFAARDASLADVFTGEQIHIPRQIPLNHSRFDIGVLTAPPSDPDAKLLLLDWKQINLLYIPLGDGDADWSVLRMDDGVSDPKIISLCVDTKHRKVYGLLSQGRVFVIDTNVMRWDLLDIVELPEASEVLKKSKMISKGEHLLQLNQTLVQCDGELMLLLMVSISGDSRMASMRVYRLDLVKRKWVEVEGIGERCLFMDVVGRCQVAPCRKPERWGVKSNFVYVAGGCDAWREIPADGTPFRHGFTCPSRWPSPIWVHPSEDWQRYSSTPIFMY